MDGRERSVYDRLLEAGKKEFLERGYEKASLRKICAGAGVTTGALYFYVQSKEELFDKIVSGPLAALGELSEDMIEKEYEDSSFGVENEKRLLEFFWKNREVFLILFGKADGTRYENFVGACTENLEREYERFFRKYSTKEPDQKLIHILVKMKIQGYLELITSGYSLEETLRLAEMMGWYTEGGFESLMEQLNNHTLQKRM